MIDKSKFDIIMELADHQVRATCHEGAIEIAGQLAKAGIFFVIEWAYNIGRVLADWVKYTFEDEAPFAKIKPLVELIWIT